jgi:hypothetical protein
MNPGFDMVGNTRKLRLLRAEEKAKKDAAKADPRAVTDSSK